MALFERFLGNSREQHKKRGSDEQELSARPVGPMHAVLSQLRGFGKPITLDMLIEASQQQKTPIAPIQVANLSNLDLRGVTFTQSGIDRLRQMTGVPDLHLDLRGANIAGGVFRPASSFDGVVIDQVTVGVSTNKQHLTFDGIAQQTHIEIKGDMSFFAVIGNEFDPTKAPDSPVHARIEVEAGARAIGGNISGSHLARLEVEQGALMNGLMASDAKSLYVEAKGANMSGANFERTVFAPGSRMANTHLVNANFSGAMLSDMDLSNSRLVGANFAGTDLTNVNLKDADINPQALHGARYQSPTGERVTIQSDQEAVAFMRVKGMHHAGDDVMQEVLRVKNQTLQIVQQAQAGSGFAVAARTASAAQPPAQAVSTIGVDEGFKAHTTETDNLIQALIEVNQTMNLTGMKRALSSAEEEERTLAAQNASNKYRVTHEEEWVRAKGEQA